MEHAQDKITMRVILLAGKILLSSGAEISRIEDTMKRIAQCMGYHNSQGYVINIFINFSLSENHDTRIIRINKNTTNLLKIFQVNSISRQLASNQISITQAFDCLNHIEQATLSIKLWKKCLAAGVISLSFLYLQGGNFQNIVITFIAGLLGFLIVEGSQIFNIHQTIGPSLIASIMPIVPGVLITTAIQDLFSRHMLIFTAKFLEALVIAFAIGSGISIAYLLF